MIPFCSPQFTHVAVLYRQTWCHPQDFFCTKQLRKRWCSEMFIYTSQLLSTLGKHSHENLISYNFFVWSFNYSTKEKKTLMHRKIWFGFLMLILKARGFLWCLFSYIHLSSCFTLNTYLCFCILCKEPPFDLISLWLSHNQVMFSFSNANVQLYIAASWKLVTITFLVW